MNLIKLSTAQTKGSKLMATPSEKSSAMEKFLGVRALRIYGRSRKESILADICVMCGEPAKEFKDDLSKLEYSISGFCQECQDKIF